MSLKCEFDLSIEFVAVLHLKLIFTYSFLGIALQKIVHIFSNQVSILYQLIVYVYIVF